jgi:hypothetical protein
MQKNKLPLGAGARAGYHIRTQVTHLRRAAGRLFVPDKPPEARPPACRWVDVGGSASSPSTSTVYVLCPRMKRYNILSWWVMGRARGDVGGLLGEGRQENIVEG